MNAPDQLYVLREDHEALATITMNRGERFNPLSSEMILALCQTFDAIAQDPSVRVVVLQGNGRGFCAGHDLKEMQNHAQDSAWIAELFRSCSELMMRITQMPQPVIAKVHGIATAAGCQLTSMCDLAVASADSRFALPGVNIGLFCSTPAVGVARNIGRKRAMEMLLTGEMIDASTALQWGLVNRVVPAAQLDAEVARLVTVIKSKSAPVIAMGKKNFYQQIEMGLSGAYSVSGQAMACNMGFEDTAEGIGAFLGRREPIWKGR